MELQIYPDSKNYTCQVIKLPPMIPVKGLDNLVQVTYQGNDCLVGKDSNPDELYLFFPAECEISNNFLKENNLFRHENLNADIKKKGFFEDSGRVKAIKFKGVISTGFICPLNFLEWILSTQSIKIGMEFNSINGFEICKKHIKQIRHKGTNFGPKSSKIIDQIVDRIHAPEHKDTEHLLKNAHKLDLNDVVVVTYKLHGTSARYFKTLVMRKLSLWDKIAKKLGIKVQETQYEYVTGSRKVIKSVGFEALPEKNHFYQEDLWSKVGKEYFEGKLNNGEAVYCEIIGSTHSGEAIQSGYQYQLMKPDVYIYRISNINDQGIEIDLPYKHMIERAKQLDIKVVPELFYGPLHKFFTSYMDRIPVDDRDMEPLLSDLFYNILLEKPSILDPSVVEEGFCIRKDQYPRPEVFKIKSKKFLQFESGELDKEISIDLEVEN